jgi:uncharacterized membrane protein
MAGVGFSLAAIVFRAPPFGWLGSLLVALSVAVALLAYTTGFRWQQHAQPARFGLLALRLGAIVCLFLTLLHPAWISERTLDEKPVVAAVLDDSASMSQPAEAWEPRSPEATEAPGAGISRYARAVSILREQVMPGLAESHCLRVYDVEAHALELDNLPPAAVGGRSPLTDTLLRVQYDLRDDPLVAIALLSDGAETGEGEAPAEPTMSTFGGLEQLRVPVYAIGVAGASGDLPAARDLSIEAVSANRRALVGNTVRVTVDIAVEGNLADARFPVSILDGGETLASRIISWPPGQRVVRAELEFVPRRPGDFVYSVAVGALPGEIDLANNRQTFPLAVRAKPLTVLYVDGVLRWEGKFIREALAADPDVNVISTVRTARVGADRGSQGILLPEQLANVDVVILGDVEARYFSADQELEALRRWVTESGGGLLLTGGYHSFGPEGFGRTVLRDILPVEFSASADPQIEQPFNLKLTDAGREHPIFHLTGDRVRDTGFFHKLPPLDGCSRVAGIKPAAEVLAVNPQISGPEGEQGLPVMVVQQVGAGRTMVFAADTTWRWRLVVGGFSGDSSFYERFWAQLVRWLASEQDETPRQLFVSTDRSRYRLGETIELNIELRLLRRAGDGGGGGANVIEAPPSAWKVTAQALDESAKQMNVPLAELGDGKYRGTLAAGRPGRLDLAVTAEPVRPTDGVDAAVDSCAQSSVITVQVDRPDLESLNARCDPQWLARVAQLSGGRSVPPDQIETWARQLPADAVRKTVLQSSGAWGDWLFGSAFLTLICAEWVLRRRRQLA